ncbi:hypothetical protein BDF14DRAFT_1734704 [Spinellus fusiger]|nr:hypothetical protein BDF14DRAFT_1734704 [Spinellus fusiger]
MTQTNTSLLLLTCYSLLDLPKDLSDASLKDQLQILQQATRLLTERALDHVETWKRSADQMQNQYRTSQDLTEQQMIITEWIKRDTEDLCVSYERIQHVMEELKEQERKREIQTDYIVDNLQSMKKHVEEAIIALEETTVVLVQAEKRYDRSKSTIVASLALGGLGGIREKQSDTTEMSKAKSYSVSKQKETPPETNKPGSIADQAVKQQLAEHQLIIDTRMKELEDLKHERRLLLEDTERLKSQLSALSEERLMETEYYKTLQVATDHYRSRTYYLEQMRTQLERELDTISLERRQLVDHVKAEKQSQSLAMETEMRRLENDLSRIRSQRDHFQLLLNEQTAKEAYEKEASDNVLASVEQQRQHILALQSEMVQARAEEPMAGPLEEELKTYIDLELELDQNGSLEEEKALKLSTDAMKNEAKEIEQHIQRWKDRSATTDMHRQMYAFMSELEIQKKEKDKLQLIIDFFENNEGQLLKQIDTVAAIYGKLEEQSTKKVLDLSQKKEQKMKLQAEKTKYAQTFPSLKAAKDKHLANVTSLRRTSEQQMEHINQLEEREKTQETQVEEKETEVRLAERTVERYRMEVDELTKKTNEYRISLERSDIQIHEVKRTRALDEEKQLKKRVDEDYEKMKRRWDMISHGDNPAEQQLAEECEELRVNYLSLFIFIYKQWLNLCTLGSFKVQCLPYTFQNTSFSKMYAYLL